MNDSQNGAEGEELDPILTAASNNGCTEELADEDDDVLASLIPPDQPWQGL